MQEIAVHLLLLKVDSVLFSASLGLVETHHPHLAKPQRQPPPPEPPHYLYLDLL